MTEQNAILDLNRFHNADVGVSFKGKDKHGQGFTLVVREGATPEMIKETMMHYFAAVDYLRGERFPQAWEDTETIPPRTEYPTHHHSFTRVCIWGDVQAMFKGKARQVSINLCNEYTTASNIVDAVETMFDGMLAYAIEFPMPQAPENAQEANTGQNPQSSNSYAPPVQNENKATTEPNNGNSENDLLYGLPFFGSWEAKNQDEYRQHDKKVVLFEVSKIEAGFDEKSGVRIWKPYGFFKGKPSQYPAYGLKIYADNTNTPAPVSAFLNTVQKSVDGHWLYAVRVAVNGEKIYMNIAGIAPRNDENAIKVMINAIPK